MTGARITGSDGDDNDDDEKEEEEEEEEQQQQQQQQDQVLNHWSDRSEDHRERPPDLPHSRPAGREGDGSAPRLKVAVMYCSSALMNGTAIWEATDNEVRDWIPPPYPLIRGPLSPPLNCPLKPWSRQEKGGGKVLKERRGGEGRMKEEEDNAHLGGRCERVKGGRSWG